jgi:hypothetical protein
VGGADGVCGAGALGCPADATGEAFEDDAPGDGALAAAAAVPGVARLSRYATKALRSVPVALTGGIPPAFMVSLGCCNTPVNAAGVIVALSFVKAGALLVPIPPAPWQDAHPSVLKIVSPW